MSKQIKRKTSFALIYFMFKDKLDLVSEFKGPCSDLPKKRDRRRQASALLSVSPQSVCLSSPATCIENQSNYPSLICHSHCPQISSVSQDNHCLILSDMKSPPHRSQWCREVCSFCGHVQCSSSSSPSPSSSSSLAYWKGISFPHEYAHHEYAIMHNSRNWSSASFGGCSCVFSPAFGALSSACARSSLRRFQGNAFLIVRSAAGS